MKKLLLATVAVIIAAPALAADLPRRSAPPALRALPILATWTGFYVGLNAGYTWAGNRSTPLTGNPVPVQAAQAAGIVPSSLGGRNSGGFIGGAQVGYNWQIGPSIVTGIEADFAAIATSRKTASFVGTGGVGFGTITTTASHSQDWLGTVRARIGFLATPELLIYGTGGLAVGSVKSGVAISAPGAIPPFTTAAARTETRAGWTLGAGAEYMITPNWTVKGEYLYYDLSSYRTTAVAAGGQAISARSDFNGHVVRAGINYKF